MKVSRTKLMEAIKLKMADKQADYDVAMQEYMAAFDDVREQIVASLLESVQSAKRATEFAHLKFLTDGGGWNGKLHVPLTVSLPRKPEKPYELAQAQRDLRYLSWAPKKL